LDRFRGDGKMGDMIVQSREPPKGVTFEQVWAMFQETDRKFQETDRQIKETGRQMKETDRQIKETGRQMKETDRQMKETDRQMKETDRQMKETDRQMKETDRKIQETERLIARTNKQLGDLGNRFGELAEYLLTPNITEKFRALNYAFTKAGPNIKFIDARGKTLTEVDVWLENGEYALAVEVKSCLRVEDVKDHIKRMEILRRYAEEREDRRKLLGAVAGAVMREPVRKYALGQGFYVIEPSGDTVKINVPEGFSPRIW
jgi:chromosome segregation ATPase